MADTKKINKTVRYQGRQIGNVEITLTSDTTGYAVIDGRSRQVVYRLATRGKDKGQMRWHCDDI